LNNTEGKCVNGTFLFKNLAIFIPHGK
jgi:hypothetical protein